MVEDSAGSRFIVHFDKLIVNAVGNSSGIFIGTNQQFGWSSHSKINANVSGITGDGNEIVSNLHIIYDDDQIDTPIDDRDLILTRQTKVGKVS